MKAYMLRTAKRIEPLGEHPRDCLIANRRLAEWQEAALRQLGLRPVESSDASPKDDPEEHIVFEDCLYFTPELLTEFIARSRALRTATVCALKPGISTLRSVVATQEVQAYPDRVEYRLRYVPGPAQHGGFRPVVIEPDGLSEVVPWPEHMLGCVGYRARCSRFPGREPGPLARKLRTPGGPRPGGGRIHHLEETPSRRCWRLMGWDTFARHWYDLRGEYEDEDTARRAAVERLRELEKSQPTAQSGGQAWDGIQDRVYVVRPDGSMYLYVPDG